MPPTTTLPGHPRPLILRTLVTGEQHGLGIARRIEQVTKGAFSSSFRLVLPASTAWRRRAGWRPRGRVGEQPPGEVLPAHLTGRQQLKTETDEWGRISLAIAAALESA